MEWIIVDYVNDRDNAYAKTLKYIYDKTLPTTLQNIEKIVKSLCKDKFLGRRLPMTLKQK